MRKIISYEAWLSEVPEEMKADALWRVSAYRKGLFLGDLA